MAERDSINQPKADERGSAEPTTGRKYLQLRTFLVQADPKALERFDELCKQVGIVEQLRAGELNAIPREHPAAGGLCVHGVAMSDHCPSCLHPDSAQARDAAQAVELADAQIVAFAKEHQWKLSEHYGATVFQFRLSGLLPFARAIERAVLAKNGLGGKQ